MIFDTTVVMEPTSVEWPSELSSALSEFLLGALASQGEAFALKDAESGRYVYAHEALALLLACKPLVGVTDVDVLEADTAKLLQAADQTATSHAGPLHSDHVFERQGVRREFHVVRQSVTLAQGPRYLFVLWRDVTAQKRREEQLRTAIDQLEQQQLANAQLRRDSQDQSLRDRSSGLSNRAHFDDQLHREIDLSTREHREFSMVQIEIDAITPAAAHDTAAVERVHETVGRLLRSNTRAMDASCRYADNQFAVLLSGVGLATAHARIEGLRRQCATQIVAHAGQELGFTVSMGVASFPHTASSKDDLLNACATALGEARKRGGNRVALASIRFQGVGGATG